MNSSKTADATWQQLQLSLTNREKELLSLLLAGYSTRQIAEELHIGEQTVRNYASQLYEKLEIKSKTELIVKYSRMFDEES